MTILNRYSEINNVVQKRASTGCIPWAYEWMIRYLGTTRGEWKIPEIDLSDFQDNYDLERDNRTGTNSFLNIYKAVQVDYPTFKCKIRPYDIGEGVQKFQYIKRLLGRDAPCIIPIKLNQQTPAHIVPIVEVNPIYVKVIWKITNDGKQDIWTFPTSCLIWLHDSGISGRKLVYF